MATNRLWEPDGPTLPTQLSDEDMRRTFLERREQIAAEERSAVEGERERRSRQAMLDAGWEP